MASTEKISRKKTTKKAGKSYHDGHRQRMRKRFLNEGMSNFEPHEVMELLLFNVIPRQDTNLLAHRLLDRFNGSLAAVFDATLEELMQVEGIGPNAATYIKMFPAVFRQYELSRYSQTEMLDAFWKLGEYAKKLFIGASVEQLYMISLNCRLQVLDTCMLAEGSVNDVLIVPRVAVERALAVHASCVVFAHNHPTGHACATREDVEVTHVVESAFHQVGICFLDHLVVAGGDFVSIQRTQKGIMRPSPLTGEVDPAFYRSFYRDRETQE